MPSNEDNKQTEFPVKENTKKTVSNKKEAVVAKKKSHSLGWFIGVIILILISITFVLPTALFSNVGGNSINFGTYNGKKISFTADPNNYFYNQYQSLIQNYSGDMNSVQGIYQVWNQAFNNTVFFTAVNEMAQKAKIIASPKVVDKTIRESYTDEEGVFNAEAYSALSTSSKASIKSSVETTLPAQMVLTDMSTVLSSNGEAEFVANMGATGRSFEYVAVNATSYPEDKTKEYGLSNPEPFTSIEVSMITLDTEENANAQLANLTSNSKSFAEAAKEVSLDAYKENGGLIGRVYNFQFANLFTEEADLAKLFSAKEGDIVGPLATASGYTLFQIEKGATLPTFEEDSDLLAVQSYLSTNNPELIDSYLSTTANEFASLAQEKGFDEAAEELGFEPLTVAATSQNIGGSTLLPTLQYTDTNGLLYSAGLNEDYYKSLYTSSANTVLAPQKVNSAYIITKVGEDSDTSSGTSFIKSYYPYIAANQTSSDLQNMIFASDKFDNQFITVFFDKVYNLSDNQ